jgi:transketolase
MTTGEVLERDTLDSIAARIRSHVVDMCAGPEGGHLGGAFSCADVLTALYFSVLKVDPQQPNDPDRDRFLLSKGHAAVGLYATLAERGFFPLEELAGYARPGSRLMGHPVRAVPGVEMPTGSLGHGLALGCGFALATRYADRPARTFVLLGDGELQEGSVWEAAIVAASLRLDGLTAIVDANGLQLTGATESNPAMEPLADRWSRFGGQVRDEDGHDPALPFLAGRRSSHYVTLSPRTYERALSALRNAKDSR